ncbi:rho GTPase-activating protein 32-like [Gigantopelta aegis]|uniref:rho GTPase-activating protein 32-like n=1 Tax=Gigantopelta aegis TaxID=1735272 RepID=UPI001B887CA2|nr:rho GTPase-activating protein 32-like [Gigantopelta aegis]
MWSRVGHHYSNFMRWRHKKPDNPRLKAYRTVINFSPLEGTARFPKLEDCSHFHYGLVAFRELKLKLCENDTDRCQHSYHDTKEQTYLVEVSSAKKTWTVCRTYSDFCMLDCRLHLCVYNRRFSDLPELVPEEQSKKSKQELVELLSQYLNRFSRLATCLINCGLVLKWLEIDNLGNRLVTMDNGGINTPAVAVAHVIKRYNAQAVDEISLEVGDIVSVIDKFPSHLTSWWRGKKGFEVGFFPTECVEIMEDTIPPFVASRVLKPSIVRERSSRKRGLLRKIYRTFRSNKKVFGSDLTEYLLKSGCDVPAVVERCTEVIEHYGIVDSIYRKAGVKSDLKKLRHEFNKGHDPDLVAESRSRIHTISSLLKLYFLELPNPLLTHQLYDKFIDAIRNERNKLTNLHNVVKQLPLQHLRTAEYLMRHLAYVAERDMYTNVKLKTMAFIWAPILLRSMDMELDVMADPKQMGVVECLICYSSVIFNEKAALYSMSEFHTNKAKPDMKLLNMSKSERVMSLEQARQKNEIITSALDPTQVYISVPLYHDSFNSREETDKESSISDRAFPCIELLNINNNFSLDCDDNLQNSEACYQSTDLLVLPGDLSSSFSTLRTFI